MAAKPITMQQLRRIIQLLKNGQSKRSIAKALTISRPTISLYATRLKATNISFDELLTYSDETLSQLFLDPIQEKTINDQRYIDFVNRLKEYAQELKRVGVTKYLIWQEYKSVYSDGYGYSQFCYYLQQFNESNATVMHLFHQPGEKMEIDFAGKKIRNKTTSGQIVSYQVFIAVLPYSGFTYVQAVETQNQFDFLSCIQNALLYFGGVPQCIISDNLKSCVKKADRYDPELTDLMNQLCLHYDTCILPARVYKPRDKPSVEKGVDLAYKRIYAPMRNMEFNSLYDLNKEIKNQLEKHQDRKFRQGDFTRRELFDQAEKQTLRILPCEPLVVKRTVEAKVQKQYHVVLGEDWHFYSVPHQFTGKQVQIIYTDRTVEIYFEQSRIAVHMRDYRKNCYTTVTDHMPAKHQHYAQQKGWTAEYFRSWASRLSTEVEEVINKILESRQVMQHTYNGCFAVLMLEKKYGLERLNKACKMALEAQAVRYKIINGILQNNRDLNPDQEKPTTGNLFGTHDNIRGPESYK